MRQKNWGEVGRGSVASPPPPTAYFATLSQFSSRSRAFGKGKETAATQAFLYGSNEREKEKDSFTFSLNVGLILKRLFLTDRITGDLYRDVFTEISCF